MAKPGGGGGGVANPMTKDLDAHGHSVNNVLPGTYIPAISNGPLLDIPTYEGSGEVVHPSIYYNASKWNGYEYWMAFTPYVSAATENPSIVCSHDGIHWDIPPRLKQDPLIGQPASGHNSDTELVEVSGTMYLYFRESGSGNEYIKRISSTDGWINVSAATIVLTNASDDSQFLSPALLYISTTWMMWVVNSLTSPNTLVKRTSADGLSWGAPSTCTVNNIPSGKDLWHLSVYELSSGYEALITVCDSGMSGANALVYLATSADGATWTIEGSPFLSPCVDCWDSGLMYRSTFIVDESKSENWYKVWYSAFGDYWGIGYTEGFNYNLAPSAERLIITPADLLARHTRPSSNRRLRVGQLVVESVHGSNAERFSGGIVLENNPSIILRQKDATDPNDFMRIIYDNGEILKIYMWDDSATSWTQIFQLDKTGNLSIGGTLAENAWP